MPCVRVGVGERRGRRVLGTEGEAVRMAARGEGDAVLRRSIAADADTVRVLLADARRTGCAGLLLGVGRGL